MKKFTWQRKGEAGWTDADVELLLGQHEQALVAEEIGPLKDKLKAANKDLTTKTAEFEAFKVDAEKETATLTKKVEAQAEEIKPFIAAKRTDTIKKLNAENKLIVEGKLTDAMKLANVTADDKPEDVIAKLKTFVEDEARADYKVVVKEEGGDVPLIPTAEEIAAQAAAKQAQAAAITKTTGVTPPAPTVPEKTGVHGGGMVA